jgi:hypothetical protein
MKYDRKHSGARSELIACAFLLELGFEVYRNVSQHGLGDLVGWRDGVFTVFDVKTIGERGGGRTNLSREQVEAGVRRLNVFLDGRCEIVAEVSVYAPVSLNCRVCGTGFLFRDRTKLFCSVKCGRKDRKRRLGTKEKAGASPEPA